MSISVTFLTKVTAGFACKRFEQTSGNEEKMFLVGFSFLSRFTNLRIV